MLFFVVQCIKAQDSAYFKQKGFVSYQASYDTVWQYFTQKKIPSIDTFMLNDSLFKLEYRKSDSTQLNRIVEAYYNTHKRQITKSYAKAFKKMHGRTWNYRRVEVIENVRYPMSSNGDKVKVEIYFNHRSKKGVLTYYLWRVNNRWYFIEKFKIRTD